MIDCTRATAVDPTTLSMVITRISATARTLGPDGSSSATTELAYPPKEVATIAATIAPVM